MKFFCTSCAVIALASAVIFAEPFILTQADNVIGKKVLEIGINDISYQIDDIEITNGAGVTVCEVTNTISSIPLFIRYGFTSKIEAFLSIPLVSSKTEVTMSGITADNSDTGLGDPSVGIKMNLIDQKWKLGGGINTDIPAGDKDFREGFNTEPFLALQGPFSWGVLNTNVGYVITNEYEEDATKIDRDPGDIVRAGIGAEVPFISLNGFSLIAEYVFENLSKSRIEGITQDGSSGSRSNVIVGLRQNIRNLKTKLGVDLGVGDEKFREYDYKIIASLTYLLDL